VLVETRNLKKYFNTPNGKLHAVDGVSLKIEEGRTVGLVGESGCGKTTIGRTIVHLLDSTGGQIFFKGEDITKAKGEGLRNLRDDMQIIFQDPYSSLNPRMTVKDTIQEPLIVSRHFSRTQLEEETDNLMDMVGIEQRLRSSYPHEMDGGRRQRVGIARALALRPKFIVCDEPVSALDVSIQAQILNLLMDIQKKNSLTYLFITHNLSVVRHISNDICVMYLGQVVESCPTADLFERTLHPYSKALLSAVTSTDIHHRQQRIILKGEVTSPINPSPGCRFADRCNYADEGCRQPQAIEEVLPEHFVSCCKVREINEL
jgi:oligopeptide/dipeptide ABC transporter ATP-binding protein